MILLSKFSNMLVKSGLIKSDVIKDLNVLQTFIYLISRKHVSDVLIVVKKSLTQISVLITMLVCKMLTL